LRYLGTTRLEKMAVAGPFDMRRIRGAYDLGINKGKLNMLALSKGENLWRIGGRSGKMKEGISSVLNVWVLNS